MHQNFYQTEYWVTSEGKKVAIKDMELRHLVNTLAYIRRNAEAYQLQENLVLIKTVPDDAFIEELATQKAEDWLNTLPLIDAMEEEIIARLARITEPITIALRNFGKALIEALQPFVEKMRRILAMRNRGNRNQAWRRTWINQGKVK